ncbi:MAG: hypothetical protein ABI612_03900 [Betaproteobacteria bacterium]
MSIDTTNLMEKVYDFFSSLNAAATGGRGNLAFEQYGGIPISEEMFKLNETDTTFSRALAIEYLSEIANKVPYVEGNWISRSSRSVDDTAGMLLMQARPVTADAAESLGAACNLDKPGFEITEGSLNGLFRFHSVYAFPPNWYDPNAAWLPHEIVEQESQTTAPPPPPPVKFGPPHWRVLPTELRGSLTQPISATHPMMTKAPMERARTVDLNSAALKRTSARSQMAIQPEATFKAAAPRSANMTMANSTIARMPIATTELPVKDAVSVKDTAPVRDIRAPTAYTKVMRPLQVAQAAQDLDANTTPEAVTTSRLNVSFEHCIVGLTTPWFPSTLMLTRQWYVPAYKQGEFSNGVGTGDRGLMPVVPTAFVAIRNLKISAQWSAPDLASLQGSSGLGPFSFIGRRFDSGTGTLTCAGMQIIGWFYEAQPVLPPASDPSLTATADDPSAIAPASADTNVAPPAAA